VIEGSHAWHHPVYVAILGLVAERAGLRPPSCPPAALEGIHRAMVRAGLSDLETYQARLEEDPALLDDLLVELTIGETYFFRNPEHFDFLRQEALPEISRRRGPEHVVRLWSAGCASGEEPYSLAVLMMEEGYEDRMRVYGTDVSRAALARARAATYGDWSLRGPQAHRMWPFLHQEGKRYHLERQVREHVHLGYLNLAQPSWPSATSGIREMDVILCRNVLIYFNRPTIQAVAHQLHATLAEGGFLITGPSDPSLNEFAPFDTLVTDWGIVYRRPGATPKAPRIAHRVTPAEAPAPPAAALPLAPPQAAPQPPPPIAAPDSALPGVEEARQALARGDWHEAALRAGVLQEDPGAAAVAVRALANLDLRAAVHACAEAAARHPLAGELRYLEALLLLGMGRLPESERAVRQALYLEPSLAVAHLTLGIILRRQGDPQGAKRAFRTAESLCAVLPPEAPVPLSDGESASKLEAVARAERTRLEREEAEENH